MFFSEIKKNTLDFVPVEDISKGVIVLNKNRKKRYLKIVEIIPINFGLKTSYEQDDIIIKYALWLKTAPSNMQIKVITSLTDVSDRIRLAEETLKTEKSNRCRKLIQNYINYLKTYGNFSTFEKHYYLIFEYEKNAFGYSVKNEEEIFIALNQKAEAIKSEFHNMGNEVLLFNTKSGDKELAHLIYKHYNKNTSHKESFEDRVIRWQTDTMLVNGINRIEDLPPYKDIKPLLAPKSIDSEESSDYIIVDGTYHGTYFIRSHSYPSYTKTLGGWFSTVVNFGFGYEVDVFFSKKNSNDVLKTLKTQRKFTSYNVNSTSSDEFNYDDKMNRHQSVKYMIGAIKQNKEDIYEMVVLVTIVAYTKEQFFQQESLMKEAAIKLDIEFGSCKRFQDEGFLSSAPLLSLSQKIFKLSHRNITTSGVAASYPFTSFALSDKDGIAVGRNLNNYSLVVYDIFDSSKYANANISIYGQSGKGKTFTLLTLITRLRYQGVRNFILAPEKQDEFRRVVDAIGGEFIDLTTEMQRINLFEIMPMYSPEQELLAGETYTEKSWLIEKVDFLKTWFAYIINDMTQSKKAMLEKVLFELYEDFGITIDNSSLYEDENKNILKRMPIMQDFYEKIIKEKPFDDGFNVIIENFINGAGQNMNGQTNVNLDNKFIVFGLENIKKEYLAPYMFMILEFIWSKCRQNRTEKKMISIDEGWLLLKGNYQVGEFVESIFKLIRGYGGGAIFSTQSVSDLYSGNNNFGNAILANSQSKVILGMEKKDLDKISEELGLTAPEISNILNAQKGEALLCAGATHIPIKIEASDLEFDMFSTDRKDLERIAKERAKSAESVQKNQSNFTGSNY